MAFLRKIVFVVAVAWLLVQVIDAASRSKRSESSSESPPENEECQGRTPCGWAIYNRTHRYVDYFMKNRCVCLGEKKCLRDEDDISISSYVYRCKEETV